MDRLDIDFKIKFYNFEGSTAELIKMIKENRVDINQVPILDILQNFWEVLHQNRGNIDIDFISEITSHLSYLLKLKSEQIIPDLKKKDKLEDQNENEEDSFFENKEDYLKEYDKYKKIVEFLDQKKYQQAEIFFPFNQETFKKEEFDIENVDLSDLLIALEKVLVNQKREEHIPIKKRTFTLASKMKEIMHILKLKVNGVSFNYFMQNAESKIEVIVIFLALLELIYLKKIKCQQKENFGEILFFKKGEVVNSKKN